MGVITCHPWHRYVFAKSTTSGLTRFYTLRVNAAEGTALFEYRPEGLDIGFRTASIPGLALADGQFHHLVVSVYGRTLLVYLDGRLLHQAVLTGVVEDGQGTLHLGGLPGGNSYFSGMYVITVNL